MVLNGEKGLKCEVSVDGVQLEHVPKFKYLGVLWINQVQMRQCVV